MTRECGECTLCCKLEKIENFKTKNVWCKHCFIGGCRIYPDRPPACQKFKCLWLEDHSLPDDCRPDLVHLYVAHGDGFFKICVDPEFPEAWKKEGASVVDYALGKGHTFIETGDQINFLVGKNMTRPEKIVLDWHI